MAKNSIAQILAVLYLRMSTDDQEESIPSQRAELTKYADKHGYKILREYIDEGISGDDTLRRTEFLRMRDNAAKGEFAVVLCWDQDRFGRFDPLDAGHWIYPFRQKGVRLETVAQGRIDWEDLTGQLVYSVNQLAKAQFLRDLSRNTTRGLLSSAHAGTAGTGGPNPYGLGSKDGEVWIVEDEAKIVRSIFKAYLKPDGSLRGIAEDLNKRKVSPPRGTIWRRSSVRAILANRKYTGAFVYGSRNAGKYFTMRDGEVILRRKADKTVSAEPIVHKGKFEAIVSQKDFDRVQAKMATNKRSTAPKSSRQYLLSGLVKCGDCHGSMGGISRSNGPKYHCGTYNQAGSGSCYNNSIDEASLVGCIVRKIQDRYLTEPALTRLRRSLEQVQAGSKPRPRDLARLRQEINVLDGKIDQGAERVLEAPSEIVPTLYRKLEQYRSERERLKVELDAQANLQARPDRKDGAEIDEAINELRNIGEALKQADPADTKNLLGAIISKIELHFDHEQTDGGRHRNVFSHGTIFIRPDAGGMRESEPDSTQLTTIRTYFDTALGITTIKILAVDCPKTGMFNFGKEPPMMVRQFSRWPRGPKWLECLVFLSVLPLTPVCHVTAGEATFNYSECLFGQLKTLSVNLASIDRHAGVVEFNGVDSGRPNQPFDWEWGDGERSSGWFPQQHSYHEGHRNYVVKVTSHYPDGKNGVAEFQVCFVPLALPPERPMLPTEIRVVVPFEMPHLRATRAPYGVSPNLTVFDDTFSQACTRETVEYVLSQAAAIQLDFANGDVYKIGGRFEQLLLRDPKFAGMYSVWYTDPMCFGVGDSGFRGEIGWSSFFHEMGHNVTLNSPANFHWGFKVDGQANGIYSETMAQIFQHATAYELVNGRQKYGISSEMALLIAKNAQDSMYVVRSAFEHYKMDGRRYCSWNDTKSERDDTFDTFMTVVYKFFEHAEKGRDGYAISGGGNPNLMKSTDLENWIFLGPLLHDDYPANLGMPKEEDISCANMFKIGKKWMLLCISHGLGCRYYLGDFKDEKYLPNFQAMMSWNGNNFFAPESVLSKDGRRVMWAWLLNLPIAPCGVQSLPRELELPEDGVLRIRPLRELQSLRYDRKQEEGFAIKSDIAHRLKEINGDAIELEAIFQSPMAKEFGMDVLCDDNGENGLRIAVMPESKTLRVGNVHAPFELRAGENLTLHVFIDKNLVEVFVNDRQAAVSACNYVPENMGINLFSKGGDVQLKAVTGWKMKSIYAVP